MLTNIINRLVYHQVNPFDKNSQHKIAMFDETKFEDNASYIIINTERQQLYKKTLALLLLFKREEANNYSCFYLSGTSKH